MELLRPQDAFFLNVETPDVPQHVCGLAVIDPTLPDGRRLTLEDLVRTVEGRLDRLPRFRQRLADPPLRLARAAWVDAEDFDIRLHIRSVSAPSPGGVPEFGQAVEELISRHLDRTRPLWEMYLIEGLEEGKVGYLLKLHHAIADGLGGIAVARTVMDTSKEVVLRPPGPWQPAPSSGRLALFGQTLKEQLLGPVRLVWAWIRQAASAPRPALQRAAGTASGLWELARAGAAPPSPLNRRVGPRRRFAAVAFDLGQVKRVGVAFGATPNEIVLASMAGGLERFFAGRGDRPPQRPLRAMVPVSVRPLGQRGVAGSWTTAYSFALSVEPQAPATRLKAIVGTKKARERWRELAAARFVMNVLGTWLPRPLHALASRQMYRDRWFNLIVSTMPGTSQARYLAGAHLEIAYPVLPLAEGVGLTVGAMTWEGRLAFGLTADAEIIPDLAQLAAALQLSFEELVRAADAAGPHPPSAPATPVPGMSAAEGR